jgi:hypothetical protein
MVNSNLPNSNEMAPSRWIAVVPALTDPAGPLRVFAGRLGHRVWH